MSQEKSAEPSWWLKLVTFCCRWARRVAVSWWRWVDSARSTTRSIYSRCGTMMTTTLFRRYSSRDDGRPRHSDYCGSVIRMMSWFYCDIVVRKILLVLPKRENLRYLKCRLLLVCCFCLWVWFSSCGAALYRMIEMVRWNVSVLKFVWNFAGSRWKMGKSMACSIVN